MKVKISDTNFNETILGVQFHNGIGELTDLQVDRLRAIGRWDFEILKPECEECKELKLKIAELEQRIKTILDGKKTKSVKAH